MNKSIQKTMPKVVLTKRARAGKLIVTIFFLENGIKNVDRMGLEKAAFSLVDILMLEVA